MPRQLAKSERFSSSSIIGWREMHLKRLAGCWMVDLIFMAKNLRFLKLVEQSGKPETVTLWSAPKKIPILQTAIRQNRVLTILHSQTGSKKEYGLMGFHQRPAAAYLIFPKRLPKAAADAAVIGIRYDLFKKDAPSVTAVQSFKSVRSVKLQRTVISQAASTRQAKSPKPEVKKFVVVVSKSASTETTLSVSAMDFAEAEAKALKKAGTVPFRPNDINTQIKSIAEA